MPENYARYFWRGHLRRLKFYNPALPITVDYAKALRTDPITLTLRFEHEDPEILRMLRSSIKKRARKSTAQKMVRGEMSEDEKEPLTRQQDSNVRNAPVTWKSKEEEVEALHQAAIDAELSAETTTEEKATKHDMDASADKVLGEAAANIDGGASAADVPEGETIDVNASSLFNDEIVLSATSTNVKGATTLYTRSVTLDIRNRPPQEIWKWFSQNACCTKVEMSEADRKEWGELDSFSAKSAIDRQKVKEGREAVKKEKADLLRARGEADRLKQEAM